MTTTPEYQVLDASALPPDDIPTEGTDSFAFGLYLAYMVSYFLHLPARFEILGLLRVELILSGLLLLLSFRGLSQQVTKTETHKQLVWLVMYILFSLPFVEWPGSVVRENARIFLKGFVFYVFTVSFAYTESRLRLLLLLFVLCQGFRILEPLYLHITEGYWGSATYIGEGKYAARLSGSPYDVINPNGLAALVTMFIMVGQPMSLSLPLLLRLAYYLAVPASVYALILTLSRTGAVALVAALGVRLLRTRRGLGTLFLVGSVLVVGAFTVKGLAADRLLSLFGSESVFATSASARIEGLSADLDVALERPLFGHGLGTSHEAVFHARGGKARLSHNLYIEIFQELGVFGLALFLLFMWSVYSNIRTCLGNVRTMSPHASVLPSIASALDMFFWLEIVFSLASYGLSLYGWYLLAGASVVLRELSTAAQGESPETVSQAETSSPLRL
jgi:putative inorganic carbon (hco3(-)) transporter